MSQKGLEPSSAASEAERLLLSDMDRELLHSERLRATVIAIFCSIVGLMFPAIDHFLFNKIELFRHNRELAWRICMVMLLLVVYELIVRAIISRRIELKIPGRALGWRYASAILELIMPTALIYSFIDLVHPVYGMLMPPASIYFLFIVVSALRMDFGVCLVTGLVAAIQYMMLYWYGYSHYHGPPLVIVLVTPFHHIAKAVGFVICGIGAGVVTSQLKQRVTRAVRLAAERNRVATMFGLYVSPTVVDQLLERRTSLDGELRNVCVLFLDIRNFTQYSEKRSPQEVVEYLNGLFAFMIDIVSKHNGIINKFLGDGFMAIFGAPLADGRECEHAMQAALEIVAQLDAEVAAGRLPPTRTGIGIHYGPALTGSIGSQRRKEYTIIGDTVNLASRIEQLTKPHNAQILVSENVLNAAASSSANIKADRIGEVAVRGREGQCALYKLA